jgi:hypothetical protein
MNTISDSLIKKCNSMTTKDTAVYVSGAFNALLAWLPSFLIKQIKRLITLCLLMPILLFGLVITVSSQEPFIHEPSPAPFDQSELKDIAVDAEGRMVAVGWWRNFQVGGSPSFPLVLIKDQPDDPWTILETPDFGWTWHHLEAVKFVPGTNGDFVAVGRYLPNSSIAHPYGLVLRYYKEIDFWQISSFNDPHFQFHFINNFTFVPDNPYRILIVGLRGNNVGGCYEFITMVVDFNLDGLHATFLPTTTRGFLRSIIPLPNGNYFAVGSAAGACDYLPWPLVMEVGDGVEIVHPNPPPETPGFWYDLGGATLLADGKFSWLDMKPRGVDHNFRHIGLSL